MTPAPLRRVLLPAAILVTLVVAAVAPIRSYDYYWHLATGRWIVEHAALPLTDPFTVASDRTAWINGEWLFQIVIYPLQAAISDEGISIARGLTVGLFFFVLFLEVRKRSGDAVALLLIGVAFAGAADRVDVRPSTAAAMLFAAAVWVSGRELTVRRDLQYALLTVVWINTHPSALLAPIVAVIALLGPPAKQPLWIQARAAAFSAASLLLNPWGVDAIMAPLRLARFAGSGEFINAEWLPSGPADFPLLYAAIAAGVVSFVWSRRWRGETWRAVLFAFLAVMAIRFVRNQGLFFATYPLLVGAWVAPLQRAWTRGAALGASAALLLFVFVRDNHLPGADTTRFPVAAIDAFERWDRGGHVYNPDQFGGYLIWRFYPERRALTDGRNELYHAFIREYARARLDGRRWKALLDRYAINVAIDEYHHERIDVVDAQTGLHHQAPVSRVYFPRREWALIAFDDVAMVFVRRSVWPATLLKRIEYRVLLPDDSAQHLADAQARNEAGHELLRARRELGDLRVIRRMAAMLSAR